MAAVERKLELSAGYIDPDDPSAFQPFVSKAVREVMDENGLAASKLGYDANRFSNYHDETWNPKTWLRSRPTYAVVSRPPELYALDKDGNRDESLMEYFTEDFQTILDHYSNERGDGSVWTAGVNAALVYSSTASSPNHPKNDGQFTPTWTIKLIQDDGISTENLTADDVYSGDLITLNMNWARERKRRADVAYYSGNVVGSGRDRRRVQDIQYKDLGH